MKNTKSHDWQKVGEVGVDAGLIWVGDPCYCVTPDAKEHPAKTWSGFCDKLWETNHGGVKQWNYKMGHPGLGVSVQSGYGDGTYPVYVRRGPDGTVLGVMIDFDEADEDTEGDE